MSAADPLSDLFAAFADPTRRAILSRLAVETLTLEEIAAGLEWGPGEVAGEIAQLRAAGLLASVPAADGDRLHLKADCILLVETWLSWFRRFRIDNHDRLQACIESSELPRSGRDAG